MVMVPLEDYNELIKSSNLVGLQKVEKGDLWWQMIDKGIRASTDLGGHEKGLQDNVEIYFKLLK